MNYPHRKEIQRYFDEYLKECRYGKLLRPATLKSYADVMRNFTVLLPEINHLGDLHPHHVTVFFERLNHRRKEHGKEVKASTIHAYYTKLIMFFRWLETKGYIAKGRITDTVVRPPNPEYTDERALDENEVSKIISAIVLHKKKSAFLYNRDLMIVNLLLYTGIRRNELLNLKVKDFDLVGQTLFVNGSSSKSKKSRKIPLHPTLMYHLTNYLDERKNQHCEYLILSSHGDKVLSSHGLKYWVERYKRLSGTHFFLHRFRHTFASNLARNNADIITIMKVMGHSSLKMTERYLRSINSENARGYINKLYH